MDYIGEIANRIRAATPSSALPNESSIPLFRIYAVLLLAKGDRVTEKDVHNAWVAWKGTADPGHESAIPFSELSDDVARQDEPYVKAICEVAREMGPLDD